MTVAGLVPRARRLPCQPCWRAQARPGQARRRACLIKPRWNTSAPRCMPRASVHCYRHTDCGLPLETHYHLGCARRWVQGALGSMGPRAATGAKPRSLRLGLAPPTKPTHAPRNDKTTGNCPTQPRQESLHVQLGHPPHPPERPGHCTPSPQISYYILLRRRNLQGTHRAQLQPQRQHQACHDPRPLSTQLDMSTGAAAGCVLGSPAGRHLARPAAGGPVVTRPGPATIIKS